MKKLRWQLLVVVLALAAIAVLLFSQQSTLLPVEPPPVQPAQGGLYSEALVGTFGRLNPVLDYYNSADHDIDRLLFSGLVRFNHRGVPEGDLAETWGISQDGKVYNFSIRQGAKWHDGKPVTAQDIVFTVDLLRSEAIPLPEDLRAFWQDVDVEAFDDRTLQFRLPEPFAPFMDYLTFGVLPAHLLSEVAPEALMDSDFNLKPVGSGPYQFQRMLVQDGQIQGVSLAAFADFYRERPYIDEIILKYYPDSSSALQAFRDGEVMGIGQITPDVLPQALQEPELNVYTSRQPRLSLVYLNLDNPQVPIFQDVTVRRALLMSLNRQWIIDHILQGQAVVAHGPILPDTWAYYDGISQVPYDPQAALEMLKEAGYTIPAEGGSVRAKEGDSLKFELAYPEGQPYESIAQAIQKGWEPLGIGVTLKAVPYQELVDDYLEPRTYQAALVDLNLSRTPDPDPYPFWHQAQASGGQNYAQWNDRQASEFLEQARVSVDLADRVKRYRNFQVRFVNEMPSLPLFYGMYSYGVSSEVQQVRVGPLFDRSDRFDTITTWYLNTQVVAETGLQDAAPTQAP